MAKKKKAKKEARKDKDMCVLCEEKEAAHACRDCGAACCDMCIIMTDKGDFCTECISANEEEE